MNTAIQWEQNMRLGPTNSLKLLYGQVQHPNRSICNVLIKVKCVTTTHYK